MAIICILQLICIRAGTKASRLSRLQIRNYASKLRKALIVLATELHMNGLFFDAVAYSCCVIDSSCATPILINIVQHVVSNRNVYNKCLVK